MGKPLVTFGEMLGMKVPRIHRRVSVNSVVAAVLQAPPRTAKHARRARARRTPQ